MKQTQHHASRIMPVRRGFTFVEFTVALVVFAIALSGLVPLLSILSRDLQPWKTSATSVYKCTSPARDGNKNGTDLAYERHTWYLTAYDDPWVRKLGAGAKVALSAAPSTPVPLESPVLVQDDCHPDSGGVFQDVGMEWAPSGGSIEGYHKIQATTDQDLSNVATWTLNVLADGWYSIQATWPSSSGLTLTNAIYQVAAAGYSGGPVTVGQNNPGAGIVDSGGITWWPLTTPKICHLAPGIVTVTLSVPKEEAQPPNLFVIADAVRIVQNAVQIKSVERSLSGANQIVDSNADVTAKVSVTVNIPQ